MAAIECKFERNESNADGDENEEETQTKTTKRLCVYACVCYATAINANKSEWVGE